MPTRVRVLGRYRISLCVLGAIMMFGFVPVGDGMRRFPPRLGEANGGERDRANADSQ